MPLNSVYAQNVNISICTDSYFQNLFFEQFWKHQKNSMAHFYKVNDIENKEAFQDFTVTILSYNTKKKKG